MIAVFFSIRMTPSQISRVYIASANYLAMSYFEIITVNRGSYLCFRESFHRIEGGGIMLRRAYLSMLMIALLLLTACQNYKQMPESSDLASSFVCPAGACSDVAPDENNMMMTSARKLTVYYTPAKEPRIELSGDCYASTFPNNKIEVYLNGGLVSTNTAVVLGASSQTSPRCVQGRYNLMINSTYVSSGSTVQLRLIGIDSAGVNHTSAVASLSLKIYSR